MKHIRFMDDKQPICENPARLDKFDTPVIVDHDYYEPESDNCKECSAALMVHNTKVFEDELAYEHNFHLNKVDPIAPARGCVYGLLIASVFWLIVGMIIWAVFF